MNKIKKLLALILVVSSISFIGCEKKEEINNNLSNNEFDIQEDNSSLKGEDKSVAEDDNEDILEATIEENSIEDKEEPIEINQDQVEEFNESKFITDTFSKYGLNVSIDEIIVKHEGDRKVVAIYKEIGRGHKNISKLVFLKNGNQPEILHLMVKNIKKI